MNVLKNLKTLQKEVICYVGLIKKLVHFERTSIFTYHSFFKADEANKHPYFSFYLPCKKIMMKKDNGEEKILE